MPQVRTRPSYRFKHDLKLESLPAISALEDAADKLRENVKKVDKALSHLLHSTANGPVSFKIS